MKWTPRAAARSLVACACLAGLAGPLAATASAAIVATGSSMPGAPSAATPGVASPAVWAYALSLGDAGAPVLRRAGTPADGASASTGWLHPGAMFTLGSFAGYIAGSCTSPAGWVCSIRLPGQDPALAWAADLADATPADGVVDLVWTYAAGPRVGGSPSGTPLGLFTASSWHAGSGRLSWWAQGGPTAPGLAPGAGAWDADGWLAGPAGTGGSPLPAPGSLALAVLALAAWRLAPMLKSGSRSARKPLRATARGRARPARRAAALSARRSA
jgi:hypothetical protein